MSMARSPASRSVITDVMFKSVLVMIVPAALLTTFCATVKMPMTISQVWVTSMTPTAVLITHFIKVNVSKSWKEFLSMTIWISS